MASGKEGGALGLFLECLGASQGRLGVMDHFNCSVGRCGCSWKRATSPWGSRLRLPREACTCSGWGGGAHPISPLLWKLLLLHYKASPEVQDNNGNTPLHLACTYGHEDVSGTSRSQSSCSFPFSLLERGALPIGLTSLVYVDRYWNIWRAISF